jgi:hypothetical protein
MVFTVVMGDVGRSDASKHDVTARTLKNTMSSNVVSVMRGARAQRLSGDRPVPHEQREDPFDRKSRERRERPTSSRAPAAT